MNLYCEKCNQWREFDLVYVVRSRDEVLRRHPDFIECRFCHDRHQNVGPMGPNPAALALRLIQVLDWPNPDGLIRDSYLPPWLVNDCEATLAGVPLADMKAEMQSHPESYPSGLLDRLVEETE